MDLDGPVPEITQHSAIQIALHESLIIPAQYTCTCCPGAGTALDLTLIGTDRNGVEDRVSTTVNRNQPVGYFAVSCRYAWTELVLRLCTDRAARAAAIRKAEDGR